EAADAAKSIDGDGGHDDIRGAGGAAAGRPPGGGIVHATSDASIPRPGLFDESVCVVVVDGFEVLRLHAVPGDRIVDVGPRGDISDQILDKNRVVVGALGDGLFVWPLQDAI